MTNNLHDKLNEEMNNDYKPYVNYSGRREGVGLIVEGSDKSYHFYYLRLQNRSIQRFIDSDSEKEVIVFELFSAELQVCLFLVNFDKKTYLKFEEDFLNRNVQRISEYSGDFDKASKPVVMVRELHDVNYPKKPEKADFLNKAFHKYA